MGVTVTTCTSQTQHRCSTEEVLLSSLIQYSSVSVTGYCVVICVPIGVCQCCKYAFFVRWSCVYQCFPVIIQYLCAASSVERKKNVAPILTSASSRKNKQNNNNKKLPPVMSVRPKNWTLIIFKQSRSQLSRDFCTVLHQWIFHIILICCRELKALYLYVGLIVKEKPILPSSAVFKT